MNAELYVALLAIWLLHLLATPTLAAVVAGRELLRPRDVLGSWPWLGVGVYLALVGAAFALALQWWPGARQDNAFLGMALMAQAYGLAGGLLLAGALPRLAGAGRPRLASAGLVALLPALGTVLVLGEHQLRLSRMESPAIWGALLVLALAAVLAVLAGLPATSGRGRSGPAASGAASSFAVAIAAAVLVNLLVVLRGPGAWSAPPYGVDLLSVVAAGALLVFLARRRGGVPGVSGVSRA